MKKLITPKKILSIILIFFLFLSYNAIGKNGQNKSLAIVSMIGVDIVDDQYQLSAKVIVPSSSRDGSTSEKIFTNTGDSIVKAVFNIELMIGHKLGMGHCDLIAVSDAVLDRGIANVAADFIRTKKIANTALLIACGESAKDMMFATSYMSNILLIKTDALMKFNKANFKAVSISLDDYYKSYESDNKVIVIPSLRLTNDEREGIRVKTGPSNTDNLQAEGEVKYFVNDGSSYVLNRGIKEWTLSSNEVRAMNCFKMETMEGKFTIDNVTDDNIENAKLVVKVLSKTTKANAYFNNGKPIYDLHLSFVVYIEEIIQSNTDESRLDKFQETITKPVQDKLTKKIVEEMNNLFAQAKEKNLDIVDAGKTFSQKSYRQWKKYLKGLEDEKLYLQEIELRVHVDVKAGI